MKVLLTPTPDFRRQYYGERALSGLQAIADVKLHEGSEALDAAGLVAAAQDADIIVADRVTEGRGEIFPQLPKLRAMVRCAVDIRNIDVTAASAVGVLVTRASPGFVPAVAELALGFMVDLSRGVSRASADFHAGRAPEVVMGRQLAGSRIGIIGYGSIGRYLAPLAKALGMEVLVADPFAIPNDLTIRHVLARRTHGGGRLCRVPCDRQRADREPDQCGRAGEDAERTRSSSICRAAISSTRRRLRQRCLKTALRARRWMSAARRTRCRSRSWRRLPNVIATPHIGGLTPQAIEHQALETVRQVAAIIKGEAPVGAVNTEHWTRRP